MFVKYECGCVGFKPSHPVLHCGAGKKSENILHSRILINCRTSKESLARPILDPSMINLSDVPYEELNDRDASFVWDWMESLIRQGYRFRAIKQALRDVMI